MVSYIFRYIIIGDSYVGKSCILQKYIGNIFNQTQEATIGIDFGSKIININNLLIKLQIWDTAGQENFKSIIRSFYRGSIGVLLVYDITNRNSYNNIITWLDEIRSNNINVNCSIILIGNKLDKENNRVISTNEGEQFANENNLLFMETSALQNTNIENIFHELTNDIYDKIKNNIIIPTINSQGVRINDISSDNYDIRINDMCLNRYKYSNCC